MPQRGFTAQPRVATGGSAPWVDFDFPTERGNEAFTEMLRDNIWKWVRPEKLIDTNRCDPDGDGIDNFPDSMLDSAFVAGSAKDWKPESNVVVREGHFPDEKTTSDHRPIELLLAAAGKRRRVLEVRVYRSTRGFEGERVVKNGREWMLQREADAAKM